MMRTMIDCLLTMLLFIGVMTMIIGIPESLDLEELWRVNTAVLVLWGTMNLLPRVVNKLRNTKLEVIIPIGFAIGLWLSTVYILGVDPEDELLLDALLISYLILVIPIQKWIIPIVKIKLVERKERKTDNSRARE